MLQVSHSRRNLLEGCQILRARLWARELVNRRGAAGSVTFAAIRDQSGPAARDRPTPHPAGPDGSLSNREVVGG